MADLISHWLLGKRILNDDSFAEAYPFLDREAFLWGCQGPDILFFHRMMPWQSGSLRSYGSSIHKGDPAAVLPRQNLPLLRGPAGLCPDSVLFHGLLLPLLL